MLRLIAIAILIIVAFPCFSDSLELDRTGDATQIQICVERPVACKIGAFAYSCQATSWSETYVGLTYAPRPEIQIALGAGQEIGGNRLGGWLWAGKGRFSAIYLYEDGESGTWDKCIAKYQVTEKFAFGWTKKQFAGEGVYADFKISKTVAIKYSGFKTPELALKVSF